VNFPDPLTLLERPDKWYVSGGWALIYAPPFPLHDERPGFWDPAHYLHFPFEPVFTFALLDEQQREIPLHFEARSWRPDRVIQTYTAPGLWLEETKVLTDFDALISRVRVENLADEPRRLHLVAWTAQPTVENPDNRQGEAGRGIAAQVAQPFRYLRRGSTLSVTREVVGSRQRRLELTLALALESSRSYSANLSQSTANHPRFALTPFYEKLGPAGLPNEEKLSGLDLNGLLYLGLERGLALPPHGSVGLSMAASLNPDPQVALDQAEQGVLLENPAAESERTWREYFGQIPRFACSDPYLEKYYYYRWYGLRLNTIRVRQDNYQHPAVCEGIGYFRLPVSYSMQAHLREVRWMRDPGLGWGILETLLDHQTEAGTFPAHLYLDWKSPEEIYHADWGGAFEALQAIHPYADLKRVYQALGRYARYFQTKRDREGSGLFDIVNQWETGQEYMSRYFAADETADLWQDMKARLKGVDASVYLYRLFQTLTRLARKVAPEEAEGWEDAAHRTGRALLERCWEPERQAFCDLAPDGRQTEALSVTSFYPYLTNLTTREHLEGLRRHLLNPEEFWTSYPVPSSSKQDPQYSPFAEWKGKRHNCPWNGRTWPMTNSHIADVLGNASRLDPSLRPTTAEFIRRFVHMMYDDHDLARPNCFEHYHPETGQASRYRGIDDYMHSYVVDLLMRYLCGLEVGENRVRVDPFPFGVEFALEGACLRGREVTLLLRSGQLRAYVDGVLAHDGPLAGAVYLKL
jgi:hypothetical protein